MQASQLFNPNIYYQFESALVPDMVLTASLNINQCSCKKSKVNIFKRSNGQNQRFQIVQGSSGNYQIITTIEGEKFTVKWFEGSNKTGEQIMIGPINNQANQQWQFSNVSDGVYTIKSSSGFMFDVYRSQTANETPVIQSPSNGRKNQQWFIKPISKFNPNIFYEFESVLVPGKALDASYKFDGGQRFKMIIYDRNNGQNQRFKIVEVNPGKYQIIASINGTNYTVQVPGGSILQGERIMIGPVNNQANQYWQFVPISEGVYTIKSFCGLVLDVYGSQTANETSVIQFPSHGGRNQQWIVRPK